MRITYYWHHYSDFNLGVFLGISCAILGFNLYSKEILPMTPDDKNRLPLRIANEIGWPRIDTKYEFENVNTTTGIVVGPPVDPSVSEE